MTGHRLPPLFIFDSLPSGLTLADVGGLPRYVAPTFNPGVEGSESLVLPLLGQDCSINMEVPVWNPRCRCATPSQPSASMVTPHVGPLLTRCISCQAAASPTVLGTLVLGEHSATEWLPLCVLCPAERCL